jgi:hypothetical protein
MKEDKMGGACGAHSEMRNSYKILVVKPEVKRPFERPWRMWEDNIKMNFKDIMLEVVD